MNTLTRQIISSSSRADPDALDDEALFAELEAELENEGETERERGIKELQRECVFRIFCSCHALKFSGWSV